jgi:hypothetical protein
MKTLSFLFTVALLVNMAASAFAQNVGINSDGSTPHGSAMLDVTSTTKGFLAPHMTALNTLLLTQQIDELKKMREGLLRK